MPLFLLSTGFGCVALHGPKKATGKNVSVASILPLGPFTPYPLSPIPIEPKP